MPGSLDARQRSLGIDVAKGIAIIAIVIGHVLRGLTAAGVLTSADIGRTDRLLYLVHLSVFALLAGIFVQPSATARGHRRYLIDRLSTFAWLYLLWSALQVVVKLLLAGRVNSAADPISWLWMPESQMWFLPCLAIGTLCAVGLSAWRPGRGWRLVALCLVVASSLALWGIESEYVVANGWSLLAPFLVGAWLGRARLVAWADTAVGRAAGVLGLAGWLWLGLQTSATPPTFSPEPRSLASVALGVLACVAGTWGVVACSLWAGQPRSAGQSRLTGQPRLARLLAPLAAIGRASLAIFLAHILAAAGVRMVLLESGVTSAPLIAVVAVVAGVGGGLVVHRLAGVRGFAWLLTRPGASSPGASRPGAVSR
ncbi:MAG: acyltransferase [Nocardioides sp.]